MSLKEKRFKEKEIRRAKRQKVFLKFFLNFLNLYLIYLYLKTDGTEPKVVLKTDDNDDAENYVSDQHDDEEST